MKPETIKYIERLFKESSNKASELHLEAFKDFSIVLEQVNTNRFIFPKAVQDICLKYGLKPVNEMLGGDEPDEPDETEDSKLNTPEAKKAKQDLDKLETDNLKTKVDLAKKESENLKNTANKPKPQI